MGLGSPTGVYGVPIGVYGVSTGVHGVSIEVYGISHWRLWSLLLGSIGSPIAIYGAEVPIEVCRVSLGVYGVAIEVCGVSLGVYGVPHCVLRGLLLGSMGSPIAIYGAGVPIG